MGWLPIFKRSSAGNERGSATGRAARDGGPRSAAATADTVQQARTRARRRLIGAAVLVVAGVIGFPLLFETQPRPVPVDIPIEIPSKTGAPALAMPSARTPPVAAAAPPVITERSEDAGRELPPPVAAASRPASTVAAARPAAPPVRNADAARAAALLDGKPVAADETPAAKAPAAMPVASAAYGPARFIVQAGAFVDAAAARDTRMKLEHLGLKTYTQVADTPQGPRVRVRLGPFASRTDADKALARAKSAGVSALVITL